MASTLNNFDIGWQKKQLQLLDKEFCDILEDDHSANEDDYSDISDLDAITPSKNIQDKIQKLLNKTNSINTLGNAQIKLSKSSRSNSISLSCQKHTVSPELCTPQKQTQIAMQQDESYERLFSESPHKPKVNLKFLSPEITSANHTLKIDTAKHDTDIPNMSDITWQFVHYDLNKTLQETKNISVNSHAAVPWCHNLKWDLDAITNIGILKWSKKIHELEQMSGEYPNAVKTKGNVKMERSIHNDDEAKAKQNYISNDRFKHLYGDAVLRNIRSKKKEKNQQQHATIKPQRNRKASNITMSRNILSQKLHKSLSQLYDTLNRFNTSQIIESEFISRCTQYIESEFHVHSHGLENDYVPKLWNIIVSYEQSVDPLSSTLTVSRCNFIKHTEIVLSKHRFIHAAKQYCDALKSFEQESLPFNPDVLRLASIMLSNLKFSVRLLPKPKAVAMKKKSNRMKSAQNIKKQQNNQIFSRLHTLGMKLKQRRTTQFEVGQITVDDQCTFQPKISRYAQRTHRRNTKVSPKKISRSESYSEMYQNKHHINV
eukprot:208564_1